MTHNFFQITGFSVDNNSIILEIDESYPENRSLVEAELNGDK